MSKTTKTTITSGRYATGSFGLYHGEPSGMQTVWFCGKGRDSHIVKDHCAHATREEARECARKRASKA